MKDQDLEKTETSCCSGPVLGFLTLRIWLAIRAIVTGFEKYAGTKASDSVINVDGAPSAHGLVSSESVKVYGLEHYHGVPESLGDKLAAEPLIPPFALEIYTMVLGPALLIIGLTTLLGIATRTSLFLMGLLYTSLTVGLILLKQDGGVAWLAIHVLMIAVALFYDKYNRFALLKKF